MKARDDKRACASAAGCSGLALSGDAWPPGGEVLQAAFVAAWCGVVGQTSGVRFCAAENRPSEAVPHGRMPRLQCPACGGFVLYVLFKSDASAIRTNFPTTPSGAQLSVASIARGVVAAGAVKERLDRLERLAAAGVITAQEQTARRARDPAVPAESGLQTSQELGCQAAALLMWCGYAVALL